MLVAIISVVGVALAIYFLVKTKAPKTEGEFPGGLIKEEDPADPTKKK